MESASPTRALLASAHPLVRAGLAALLRQALPNASPPNTLQYEAASLEEVMRHLTRGWADLLLLDFALIAGDPVACLRRIRGRVPECRILLLTDVETDESGLRTAGATMVLAASSAGELVNGIRRCLGRGSLPAPHLPIPFSARFPAPLTSRQAEVFRLLAEGCSTKTIARRLDLAVGTVKVHLAGIYRALGATSRLEAVVKARRLMELPAEAAAAPPEALPLFNWQWDNTRSPAA